MEMRIGAKKPKTFHNQEEPDAKALDCLAMDEGVAAHDGVEVLVDEEKLSEQVLDPANFFGAMDELFEADPTGRTSGLASVAKPVPKKKRSGAKGKAMDCIPDLKKEIEAGDEEDSEVEEEDADKEEVE